MRPINWFVWLSSGPTGCGEFTSPAAVCRAAVALMHNLVAPASRLCHMSSSRIMWRPGTMTALGPLAGAGNKRARAAEAGISASPWPKQQGPQDAIRGPPALGCLSQKHM